MTPVDWVSVDATLSREVDSRTVDKALELGIQHGDSRFQRRFLIHQLLAATAVVTLVVLSFVARGQLHDPETAVEQAPQISSITPSEGPGVGGQRVTIAGTGLAGTTSVDFGDVTTEELRAISATEVVVTTPPHDAGPVHVSVNTAAGASRDSDDALYTYLAAPPSQLPTVTSIEPNSGSTDGGQRVAIRGTHLQGATAIAFGGSRATEVVSVSATRITLITPRHDAGVVDVTVTTANGTSAAGVEGAVYQYVAKPLPAVTAIEPIVGSTQGHESVRISGTGFTGVTMVRFGDVAATDISIISDTQLTVMTPPHAEGPVDVTVSTADGTSPIGTLGAEFAYVVPPEVTSNDPTCGPVEGGQNVTLKGTGFAGPMTVLFGDVPGTNVNVISNSELTVKTPEHKAEEVNVTVSASGVASVTSATYTYAANEGDCLPIVD